MPLKSGMVGVDTNILVRLLAADDSGQTEKLREFLSQRSSRDPAFVSAIVLIETLWVLQRRLGFSRRIVIEALRSLLSSQDLRFQHGDSLAELVGKGTPSTSDIVDHLIAWSGESAGCARTFTFDRHAARLVASMELLA